MAPAQSRGRLPDRWELDLSVASRAALLEDGNGTIVRADRSIGAGLTALWRAADRASAGASLGTAFGGVTVEDDGASWDAGSLARLDLFGVVTMAAGPVTLRAGAGPVWLIGPDDVAPFRGRGAASPSWGGELAADAGFTSASRFRLRAGVDAIRLAPGGLGPGTSAGAVVRFRLGVAYAL